MADHAADFSITGNVPNPSSAISRRDERSPTVARDDSRVRQLAWPFQGVEIAGVVGQVSCCTEGTYHKAQPQFFRQISKCLDP
jgi:hypothetical protein